MTATFDLYKKHLIPTAQLLMLLGSIYENMPRGNVHPQARKDRLRNLFLQNGFDLLDLVNCELQSWPSGDPAELGIALEPLQMALRAALTNLGALSASRSLKTVVSHAIQHRTFQAKNPLTLTQQCREIAASLINSWERVRKPVYQQLEYSDGVRHQWLTARYNRQTPLMPNRRISHWRTLAKNSDWTDTLALLGLPADLNAELVKAYSSVPGRKHLPDLIQRAFGGNSVPAIVHPADVLPQHIDVARATDGTIRVTAVVGRMATAGNPELAHYLLSRVDKDKLLSSRTFERFCGVKTFALAVEEANAWAQEECDYRAQVMKEFEAHCSELVRQKALARLKDFSPQELEVLKEHFRSQS